MGLFFLQTSPILNRIAAVEKESTIYNNENNHLTDSLRVFMNKNEDFKQIDDTKKARLKKFLPDSIDNVRLIIDINEIASANGMTIRNISIKRSGDSDIGPDSRPYGVATLGFSISGPYQTFKNFLAALETSLRLIDVTSLSFSAGDKDQYEYNFEVRSYWLK